MRHWELIRLTLLATTLSGILAALGHALLGQPVASNKQQNNSIHLASELPLPDWTFIYSSPLNTSENGGEPGLLGRRYLYQKQDWSLIIQMYYIQDTRERNSEIQLLVQNFTNISPMAVSAGATQQQSNIGFYTLFSDTKSAYLSACINPRGGSTVTRKQFTRNRLIYDLRPIRLWGWILGQHPLQDKRCLWTHLSIPLEDASPESLYSVLEEVWFDWYALWKSRFPDR